MVEADYLFTIAEVAAAFAGFSTLVVVVAQRSRVGTGELSTIRLTNMLRLSLLVILFSLVPYLPMYSGISSVGAWRISSGLFAALWFMYMAYGFRHMVLDETLRRASRIDKINFFVIETLAVLALAGGALGAWGDQIGLVYLTCLLVMLYISGWLFLEQVIDISKHEPDA